MEKVKYLADNETPVPSLKVPRSKNSELLNTCTYGLEYVIDEIFKDDSNKPEQHTVIDWSGISDLTMD